MLEIIEENVDAIIMSEAHFHLNGSVNKQNFRYWAPQDPHEVHERPLYSPKVTVWCAIGKVGLIVPYFLMKIWITTTVNSARYTDMINNFLELELRSRRTNNQNVWFQQHGDTAHTATAAMAVVRTMLPDRLISRCDVPWPPRSPELSICDFFLWFYLQPRVYEGKPRTLEEKKGAIRKQIGMINQELLERVEANFRVRLQMCILQNGHHL